MKHLTIFLISFLLLSFTLSAQKNTKATKENIKKENIKKGTSTLQKKETVYVSSKAIPVNNINHKKLHARKKETAMKNKDD